MSKLSVIYNSAEVAGWARGLGDLLASSGCEVATERAKGAFTGRLLETRRPDCDLSLWVHEEGGGKCASLHDPENGWPLVDGFDRPLKITSLDEAEAKVVEGLGRVLAKKLSVF